MDPSNNPYLSPISSPYMPLLWHRYVHVDIHSPTPAEAPVGNSRGAHTSQTGHPRQKAHPRHQGTRGCNTNSHNSDDSNDGNNSSIIGDNNRTSTNRDNYHEKKTMNSNHSNSRNKKQNSNNGEAPDACRLSWCTWFGACQGACEGNRTTCPPIPPRWPWRNPIPPASKKPYNLYITPIIPVVSIFFHYPKGRRGGSAERPKSDKTNHASGAATRLEDFIA